MDQYADTQGVTEHQPGQMRKAVRAEKEKREQRKKDSSSINRLKNYDITKIEPPWVDVTTVMMRNLPNKYTQQMLLAELADLGFHLEAHFDFFYLPMDHTNAANLGYCFINFVETSVANSFAAALTGKRMRRFNSNKTVIIMPASIQGYERNYHYYSATRVAQAEEFSYRPIFSRSLATGSKAARQRHLESGKPSAQRQARGQKGPEMPKAAGAARHLVHLDAATASQGFHTLLEQADIGQWVRPSLAQEEALLSEAMDALWLHPTATDCWELAHEAPEPARGQENALDAICPSCGSDCGSRHKYCCNCGAGLHPREGLQGWEEDSHRATSPREKVPSDLDVLRGRMMLLAALEEMQNRNLGASS